jgi:nitrite reductase/ring-hydroxylating ferredoxin subunit
MFIALERLLNLEDGYRQVFQVQGRSLLLLVVEGRARLLENRCFHQAASLHNAILTAGMLHCVRHGIEFELASGRALNAQCPGLAYLPLAYKADRVGIEL